MLCGLLPVNSGRLRVAGVDMRRTAARARAKIGYMSQKFSLYANLTVHQNLKFFSSAYGLRGPCRRQRIDWATRQFELADWHDVRGEDLPLGYKQRLAMACALMHHPEVLFLDEPTSGVDPLARRQFWRQIHALSSQGVTVMVTTHFMEEAEYCHRLAIMASGEILKIGTPDQIRGDTPTGGAQEATIEDAFVQLVQSHQPPGPNV
jgi:ABC-2 type transport system ATP-binding protein